MEEFDAIISSLAYFTTGSRLHTAGMVSPLAAPFTCSPSSHGNLDNDETPCDVANSRLNTALASSMETNLTPKILGFQARKKHSHNVLCRKLPDPAARNRIP